MARKAIHEETYLIVRPKVYVGRWQQAQEDYMLAVRREEKRVSEQIAEQIRRHCDDIDGIHIQEDFRYECEHCEYHWTEESTTYNGGCCDKDIEAEEARKAAADAKP